MHFLPKVYYIMDAYIVSRCVRVQLHGSNYKVVHLVYTYSNLTSTGVHISIFISIFKSNILIAAVSCCTPPRIGNGYCGTPTRTTYGGTVRYYCNSGYILSGSATVTCLTSGSWGTRPTCLRKYCMHVCA